MGDRRGRADVRRGGRPPTRRFTDAFRDSSPGAGSDLRSGTARLQAQRKLDRRLAEFGLRPQFPGSSRLPPSERRKVRATYEELRTVIDEVRTAEREGVGEQFRTAIFIKFPFFTDEEMAAIYAHPYPRRGATADAALAILARRLVMSPASLSRYLFPRRRRK